MRPLFIFGAGGQAHEVAELAARLHYAPVLVVRPDEAGTAQWPVMEEIGAVRNRDGDFAVGIGDNAVRRRVAERYADLAFPNLIDPDATVGRSSSRILAQSRGVIVQAGARVTANVRLGDFCNLNTNATVSHDCDVGAFATVGPGASVGGNAKIEQGAWIGIGASVINGSPARPVRIGAWAIVGAGAVVVHDCDPEGVYVGIPARRMK